MIIRAKFEGICPQCNSFIKPGEKIVWEQGLQAYHEECPWPEYRLPKPEPGLVRFYPDKDDETAWHRIGKVIGIGLGRFITVVRVWRYHYEGRHFHFGVDRGYPMCADCRPATDGEAFDAMAAERLDSYFDWLESEPSE